MTSPFVQLFENVNFSSYKGLSAHQIWFNLGQGKQSYGGEGGRNLPPPQVENVFNRPGEIGLRHRKVKYKSDLRITGSFLQWNISRCAVTKGTVVLKSVMLTDLAFLSTSRLSEFSRVPGTQLLIPFKNLIWALYYFPYTLVV